MKHPARILSALEGRARKRFGQHFLASPGVVQNILRLGKVGQGDRVLEIGPGLGVMTEAMLDLGAEVTAVELDRDLAEWLRESLGDRPNFHLVEADATRVDWAELLPCAPDEPRWRVVSNLPYNVGTGLVTDLLEHPSRIERMVVMLQKEVIDRMCAPVGARKRGSLSMHVQSRASARVGLKVPPGAFYPPPKVDSLVAELILHAAPETGGAPVALFDRANRALFASPRKAIRNPLSRVWPRAVVDAALEQTQIAPKTRAAALDADQLGALAMALDAQLAVHEASP